MKTCDYIESIVAIVRLQNTITFTHYADFFLKGGGDANGCILNKIIYKANDILPIYVSQAAIDEFTRLGISNYKEMIIHEVLNRSMKNRATQQQTYAMFRNPKAKIFHLDHNAPMAYICKKIAEIDYKQDEEYIRNEILNLLTKESGIDCITVAENKLRNKGTDANNKSRKERIKMSKSIMIRLK